MWLPAIISLCLGKFEILTEVNGFISIPILESGARRSELTYLADTPCTYNSVSNLVASDSSYQVSYCMYLLKSTEGLSVFVYAVH